MRSRITDIKCPECGSNGIRYVSTEMKDECQHTFCYSENCGYYEMNTKNREHPAYRKNGKGHHTPEKVKKIIEIFGDEEKLMKKARDIATKTLEEAHSKIIKKLRDIELWGKSIPGKKNGAEDFRSRK